MRLSFSALFIVVFSLCLLGCSRDQAKEVAKMVDPRYPKKPATHVVELFKVQIGTPDFNLSTFGNPLDIRVKLLQDGNEIALSAGNAILDGRRGERLLQKPIQWVVDFNPQKNYQIVLEEQSIIANAFVYSIPRTPQIGYWPIAENYGRIPFGKESYIQFRDKVAE